MTNEQLYLAIGIPCIALFMTAMINSLAVIWSNRLLDRRIDDTKDVLRAEIKAFRVETLGEFRELRTLVETQTKLHIAEYHK